MLFTMDRLWKHRRKDGERLAFSIVARLFVLVLIFSFVGASVSVVDDDAPVPSFFTQAAAVPSVQLTKAGDVRANCCVDCPQGASYRRSEEKIEGMHPRGASCRLVYALVNETAHSLWQTPPRKPPRA